MSFKVRENIITKIEIIILNITPKKNKKFKLKVIFRKIILLSIKKKKIYFDKVYVKKEPS